MTSLDDIIGLGDDLDGMRIVDEVLPPFPKNWHVPIFKYLRDAGQLSPDGTLIDPSAIDARVAARASIGINALMPPTSYRPRAKAAAAGDFSTLGSSHPADDVLMFFPMLKEETIDLEELRLFLCEHRRDQFEDGQPLQTSQWSKAVCLYDRFKYRREPHTG